MVHVEAVELYTHLLYSIIYFRLAIYSSNAGADQGQDFLKGGSFISFSNLGICANASTAVSMLNVLLKKCIQHFSFPTAVILITREHSFYFAHLSHYI